MSSGEVQKQTSRMMDCGVMCRIASRWCGVCDSDLMPRSGMPSAWAVVCARWDAKRSSRVVAWSETMVSVPRACGLEWAFKWMSMRILSTVELASLV